MLDHIKGSQTQKFTKNYKNGLPVFKVVTRVEGPFIFELGCRRKQVCKNPENVMDLILGP